jgi:soluble lytic murein transglycosylase-like protein
MEEAANGHVIDLEAKRRDILSVISGGPYRLPQLRSMPPAFTVTISASFSDVLTKADGGNQAASAAFAAQAGSVPQDARCSRRHRASHRLQPLPVRYEQRLGVRP